MQMKKEKQGLYLGIIAVLAVVLLVSGVSPIFLLFLACPLMMFMGHGSDNHNTHSSELETNEHAKEK